MKIKEEAENLLLGLLALKESQGEHKTQTNKLNTVTWFEKTKKEEGAGSEVALSKCAHIKNTDPGHERDVALY